MLSLAALALLTTGLSLPSDAAESPYHGFVAESAYVKTSHGDLYVEVHRPAEGRMPVLLQMTPYRYLYGNVRANGVQTSFYSDRYAKQGYAVAFADVLGTGESDGCWDYGGPAEAEAGAAVVEWLGTRPWSTGRVGMIGTSYDGAIGGDRHSRPEAPEGDRAAGAGDELVRLQLRPRGDPQLHRRRPCPTPSRVSASP